MKSGFWRGCHLWTNPGAGFQTDPVSASKQIQISGTFCVLLYDVAAAKKLSQKIWALESNFKLNFNFNQCQDWEVGHCQWNKLRCKSVAEFSIKQIFYSFTVCQTEIGFILVTQHILRWKEPSSTTPALILLLLLAFAFLFTSLMALHRTKK